MSSTFFVQDGRRCAVGKGSEIAVQGRKKAADYVTLDPQPVADAIRTHYGDRLRARVLQAIAWQKLLEIREFNPVQVDAQAYQTTIRGLFDDRHLVFGWYGLPIIFSLVEEGTYALL